MTKESNKTEPELFTTSQDLERVVRFKADDMHLSLNTSNDVKKQRRWPFGPGDVLDGWGGGLTDAQVDAVQLKLRKGAYDYYESLNKESQDKLAAQGVSFIEVYAKKNGNRVISEVLQEGYKGKPVPLKEQHLSMEDARKYLASVEKDAPGNAMLPQLKGAFDGKSEQAYRILNNGVAIVRYKNVREFNKDIATVGNQRDIDDDLTSITNTKFRALVSAVEITPQNEKPCYKIVVSDGKGVRVNTIKKEEFDKLIEHNQSLTKTKDLTDQQKLQNREQFVNTILKEYTPLRTHISDLKGVKSALLNQVQNEKLFGIFPIPGILGGRKDRLKRACKTAHFTFSDKDGVVIDQDKFRPYRKTITINGQNNEDTYIDLGHDCSVKINAAGQVMEDAIYKLEKDGSRKKVDISGDMFRMPLTLSSSLVDALKKPMTKIGKFLDLFNLNFFSDDHKDARKRAKDVMKAYKKLELIICTNPDNVNDRSDSESEKTLGLSFMALGKTHGLRFSKRERIATTIAVTGVAIGASIASAGIAGAALGVSAGASASAGGGGGQGASSIISAIGSGIAANAKEIGSGITGGVAGIAGLSAGAGVKNNIDNQSVETGGHIINTRKINIKNVQESSR